MVIKPSALNVAIIWASMVVATFLVRLFAGWIEDRNPRLAGAISLVT